jgi:hypothetical protein
MTKEEEELPVMTLVPKSVMEHFKKNISLITHIYTDTDEVHYECPCCHAYSNSEHTVFCEKDCLFKYVNSL